jgi:hypothetical protein
MAEEVEDEICKVERRKKQAENYRRQIFQAVGTSVA